MLNESQAKVAQHRQGPLLVLAGAGTGKTRTLTHRFANLVSEGIKPERILLLTFTRKAAAEMNERATKLLENLQQSADLSHVGGTFHATAFRWLKTLKLTNSAFNIVDDRDCKRLVKMDLSDSDRQQLEAASISIRDLLQLNSLCVNLQEEPTTVIARFFPQALGYSEWLSEKVITLKTRKAQAGVLDYDDILQEWLNALRSPSGKFIRQAYDYVMVDEYQDTSRVQVEILKELVKGHQNIMAVGDDCQSIYSFRGALSIQMRDFINDFNDAEIVKLEDNYRSTQPILDACNNVISESNDVYPKDLQSANDKIGLAPVLIEGRDQQAIAAQLMDKVYNNLHQGITLDQQAILFRSSMHAMALEKLLVQERVPYKKFGGIKMTEAAHVRDYISLISCCFTQNSAAWLRVLLLIPGIGEKTAEKIVNSLLDSPNKSIKVPVKAKEIFQSLRELTNEEWSDEPTSEFLQECIHWYQEVAYTAYDDASSRLRDIQNLNGHLIEAVSLSDFAADLLLDQVNPDEDEFEAALTLSTIHSAKGKEWDCVYILNVADGALPVRRSSTDLEEERRLLYVAMTRAREQLHLFWPTYSGYQSDKANQLSPFLGVLKKPTDKTSEIPQEIDDNPTDDLIYVYDEFC
jgi:DNA helicase II / ATP-dependent DNA helicase PcrA